MISPIPQKKLIETERYHDRALALLNAMFEKNRQNLISRYGDDYNASVKRHEWRVAMKRFGVYYNLARDVEENLAALGKIELLATFVKPVIAKSDPEPVMRELTVMDKFFCQSCKKIKGIPHNHRRYVEGQKVNFTQKGVRGVAINRVASINSISGQQLMLDIGTKLIPQHMDNVTPEWAPSPLMYSTMDKCWCDIDPTFLPGGIAQ